MTVSVRLDEDLQGKLEWVARMQGLSKSELIRRCMVDYLSQEGTEKRAWELGKSLFGRVGSGRSDLSLNHKKILKEKLNAQKDRD